MARKKTRTVEVEYRPMDPRGPTAERKAKDGGELLEVGGSKRDGTAYHFTDPLLERARKRDIINARQFAALHKFRHHWHHAGLEATVSSSDLNRVFATDVSMFSGMAKSEKQAFHRQQYRQAVQRMGIRLSHAVEEIVCNDCRLEDYGRDHLEWSHPLQARASATEMIRTAGDICGDLWRIGRFDDERR